MIYSPGFAPAQYNNLNVTNRCYTYGIWLLNFDYQSKFYGQDVLKADYKPRALIATYQDLGLIKDNVLTISKTEG
jgi:hypothetical protein